MILVIFKNLEMVLADFRKYSNIKYHGNPFSGIRVTSCGRMDERKTDRHDEASCRFLQLWNAHKIFLRKPTFQIDQKCNQLWQTYKNTHYMKKMYPLQANSVTLYLKIQFVTHRDRTASQLYRRTSYGFSRKFMLFIMGIKAHQRTA